MNKYKQHYIKDLKYILPVFLIAIYCFRLLGLMSDHKEYQWPVSVKQVQAKEIISFDTPVEEYIYKVFGEDHDKAMLLLSGNENCGGENKGLNTYATNVNKSGSMDRGIFQINDYYHPSVSNECAFDHECNTDYAYRMFVNDNRTFVRWTAGRCLGI